MDIREHNEALTIEKAALKQQLAGLQARAATIIGILMDDTTVEISRELIDKIDRVQISLTENPDTQTVTLTRTFPDTDQASSLNDP